MLTLANSRKSYAVNSDYNNQKKLRYFFFVLFFFLQEKAAELLRAYGKSEFSRRSVLSFSEVRGLSSDVCADESTLCMALLQLQREKRATVALHEGEKVGRERSRAKKKKKKTPEKD